MSNMIYTGTNHFVNVRKANEYYKNEMMLTVKEARNEVKRKIEDGEIQIGKPSIYSTEKLYINGEGRYVIGSPTFD